MLRDDCYTGIVTYDGAKFDGVPMRVRRRRHLQGHD
jgi:hypothetical protein